MLERATEDGGFASEVPFLLPYERQRSGLVGEFKIYGFPLRWCWAHEK